MSDVGHPPTMEIPRRVQAQRHPGLRELTVDVATTREMPHLPLAPLSPPARARRRRWGVALTLAVLLPAVVLLGWTAGGGGWLL